MNYKILPRIFFNKEGDGGAAPEPEVEAVEEAEAPEPEAEENAEPEEEEAEEVEVDGRTYVLPKSLKPHLMMEKDYRHKTMEAAEKTRAFEVERAAHAEKIKSDEQFATMTRQFTKEVAQMENIKSQIEHYEKKVDWARWRQENPEQALQGTLEYNDLIRQRNVLGGELNTKIGSMRAREAAAQKEAQDRYARELPLKIKDWSPAKETALKDRAMKHYGFAKGDIDGIVDARAMQILADADAYHQLLATMNKTPKTPQEAAKPVTKVKTVARASSEPSERDSDKEWLRKRNAQVAARKKTELQSARR